MFWKVIFRLENFLWSTFSCFTLDIQGHLLRFGTWTPKKFLRMLNFGVPNSHLPPHVRYDWMILGCLGFLKFMIKLDHFTVTLFCEGSRWYYPHQRNQPKKNKPTKTFQNDPNFFSKKTTIPTHVTLPTAQPTPHKNQPKQTIQPKQPRFGGSEVTNQAIEAASMSQFAGWGVMVSHRSGETEDRWARRWFGFLLCGFWSEGFFWGGFVFGISWADWWK